MPSAQTFRNSSAHPIRFDRLHPGSFFHIVAEPSRNIRRSRDQRVYRKSRNGFFSVEIEKKTGLVLYPEDLVMPLVPADKPARPAAPSK